MVISNLSTDGEGEVEKNLLFVHQAIVMEYPGVDGLRQYTFISHSSGGWESKIKVFVDSLSGEDLLPHS